MQKGANMNNVQNANCFDQLPSPSMKCRGDSLENDLVASWAKRMTGEALKEISACLAPALGVNQPATHRLDWQEALENFNVSSRCSHQNFYAAQEQDIFL